MRLGKVIGTVVSTILEKGYDSRKILVIQPVDPNGHEKGIAFLAIDMVQAGVGETVLTIEEGNSARQVVQDNEIFTVKTVVAAIVDEISVV